MSDDEQLIHIGAVGRVLYTARWLVASLFVVFLAAYALAVWLGASYSARAVIRTPDLTVAEFKRVLETAADQAIVSQVSARDFKDDAHLAAVAGDVARDPNFADHFVPIYTISRTDLRETALATPASGEQILAVQTNVDSRDRRTARQLALLLAEQFADGALKSALVDYVTYQRGTVQSNADRLDAKQAGDRALLERVEQKIGELRKMRGMYPDAEVPYPTNVPSSATPPEAKPFNPMAREPRPVAPPLTDAPARYLSPVAQLVGAESEAINIRDAMRESDRKRRILDWQRDFFTKVATLDLTSLSGAALLNRLESMLKSSAMDSADPDSVVREARATILADLSVFRARYVDGYTVLRMPPERPPRVGPSLAVHLVGGVAASAVLAVLLTLALRWRRLSAVSR
jgi:hypothetical protein